MAANRAAGRPNAPAEFAWFIFEPVHLALPAYASPRRCERCGAHLDTPIGPRVSTESYDQWLARGEDNCFAMPDVPDEVFWPVKEDEK